MTALKTQPAKSGAAYADDFYTWTQEQAARLRSGDSSGLDRETLAEEIESLGKSQFASLVKALQIVPQNMLKIDHGPTDRTRTWSILIALHRTHVSDELGDNPGLRNSLGEAIERGYRTARLEAADKTGLPLKRFPDACPYTYQDIMDRPFAIDSDERM